MAIQIKKDALLQCLQFVMGVVERRQTLPILSHVLLKIHENRLSVTGTDLEAELIGYANLESDSPDLTLTLPGRKLFDICRSIPDGAMVNIISEENGVIIKSGRGRYRLSTLPASDFPNIEDEQAELAFSMEQAQFKGLIDGIQFAMAQEDVRYYLNGMFLGINPNKITAVSADGHRMALSQTELLLPELEPMKIIVPRKGIGELSRLLSEQGDPISVKISSNHISIVGNDFVLTSKLIDGRFPDYQTVIPRNGDKVMRVNREALRQVLSRVSILSHEKKRGVRFELKNNLLIIKANNPDHEEAEEELEVDYQSDPLAFGFNVNYLLDILSVLDSDSVKFTFSNPESGVLVESPDNNNYLYVIMPMRL